MSHLESGFCVTDIVALAQTVKEQCPDLELVKQKTYRTWVTDHGQLAGDYPIPAIYQIKLLASLKREGVDVHAEAAACGVTLPANLLDLEKTPWTLEQQQRLFRQSPFNRAYKTLSEEVISKDAEYVIRYKQGKGTPGAYEIGLVPHPVRKGEFMMMTDFYRQGSGLLHAQGLGRHQSENNVDTWGGELKQGYAVRAAERSIVSQIQAGNPEFGSYKKVVLPDGKIKIEVFPR